MEDTIYTDAPIKTLDGDLLQRSPFAERITKSIVNNKSSDSIVIGIYGKWGEGKTSALNLIKEHLNKISPQNSNESTLMRDNEQSIICIDYNPWLFKDVEGMLLSFFSLISKKIAESDDYKLSGYKKYCYEIIEQVFRFFFIDKCFDSKTCKKWFYNFNRDSLGKILLEYGMALSAVPVIKLDGAAKAAGKLLNIKSIDERKEELKQMLDKEKKKIVIFVDDIDRLDKSEIHTLLKLVKLTANFPYFTYVLAFDEEIVASAIGEKYGCGDFESGFDFLEKIIQIPLKLPVATQASLNNYLKEGILSIFKKNEITLNQKMEYDLHDNIEKYLFNSFENIRAINRYINSLQFTMSLLSNEVNCIDIVLLEAIKQLYPKIFNEIRNNPIKFTDSYCKGEDKLDDERAQIFKDYLINLLEIYPNEKSRIEQLLKILFKRCIPAILDSLFWGRNNYFDYGLYFKEKRVSIFEYLVKYLIYTTQADDISEIKYNEFFNYIKNGENELATKQLREISVNFDKNNLSIRAGIIQKELNNTQRTNLIKVLADSETCFDDYFNQLFHDPYSQLICLIDNIIRSMKNSEDQINIVSWICDNNNSFEFIIRILERIKAFDLPNNPAYESVIRKFILRLKTEFEDTPIWVAIINSYSILEIWDYLFGENELMKGIEKVLEKEKDKVEYLIKAFTPNYKLKKSGNNKIYYYDFNEECFSMMKKIVNVDYIYGVVEQRVGIEKINNYNYQIFGDEQTDENLLLQFAYFYNLDKNNQLQEGSEDEYSIQ
jgi:Cdc6-like AAA superfamily ATPase